MSSTVLDGTAITAMICTEWLENAYCTERPGINGFNDFHGGAYEVRSMLLALAPHLDHAWRTVAPDDELDGLAFDYEFVPDLLNDMLAEWNARKLMEGDAYQRSPFIDATPDTTVQRARRLFFEFPIAEKAAAFDRLCVRIQELPTTGAAQVNQPLRYHILNTLQLHNEYDRWRRASAPSETPS